ncbi:Trigger factor, ribosome-binding, bacterial [Sesbania bispinosa]|nr:Trigger factor, ribosome-binding, bacterial [Sesbania bispinosa]
MARSKERNSTNSTFRRKHISIEVSGSKTQRIFDDVFQKMVVAAQPIPGFRRVKGGKTPDIPKDILLEVLGPSRVFKEVIKKIINSTVAEYVEKIGSSHFCFAFCVNTDISGNNSMQERLIVSQDLRVEQSFEDLETTFEEGEKFRFDVVLQLQK